MRLLIFGIVIVIGLAVITYSTNNNVAYGQLEKYKSYDPITGQFNITKYLLEDASPEIRAAYQELMIAFANATLYNFGMKLKYNLSEAQMQELINSQAPKLIDIGREFGGLVAEQDPEIAAVIKQKPTILFTPYLSVE